MMVSVIFIIIFLSSSVFFRERKKQHSTQLDLDPPPQILVWPARSNSSRDFMDGQVRLMRMKPNSTLVLDQRSEKIPAKPQVFLLQNKEAFKFDSTLISADAEGRLIVHTILRDEPKRIFFRAGNATV